MGDISDIGAHTKFEHANFFMPELLIKEPCSRPPPLVTQVYRKSMFEECQRNIISGGSATLQKEAKINLVFQ